jgi:hypothetical protein
VLSDQELDDRSGVFVVGDFVAEVTARRRHYCVVVIGSRCRVSNRSVVAGWCWLRSRSDRCARVRSGCRLAGSRHGRIRWLSWFYWILVIGWVRLI